MKAYNIILFMILHSFITVVSSQEIRDGFKIFTQDNVTWFEDVNKSKYMGPILNNDGKNIAREPSYVFSSKEKVKKIEVEVYSEEERNYLLIHFKPTAILTVRANDGTIASVSFIFKNLTDPSVIDIKKLQTLQEKIKTEILFDNLLFNGEKAVSGYMLGHIFFFRP